MTKRNLIISATLTLILSTTAWSAPETALRGARVIDGLGGTQENAVILLEGEKIGAVGPVGQVKIPPGTKVIDVRGKTVIPGLISDHSHVGQVKGTQTAPANYTRANILRQLKQYQAYGVTTVTSLGMNAPPVFYALRAELHAGKAAGADLFGADKGIGVPNGAPPVSADATQLDRPSSAAEAREDVHAAAARKTDFIKIWLDDFAGSLKVVMSPEISQAVIAQAHKDHVRVAGHIFYLEDARRLLAQGVDVLGHGVRDRGVDRDFIGALVRGRQWYIPTLQLDESFYLYGETPELLKKPFFTHALEPALLAQFRDPAWRKKNLADPKRQFHHDALATNQKNFLKLYRSGAQIGFGTDSGANPMRIPGFAEHRELQLMVAAGVKPLEAITLATGQAAALLNLGDRGVIAPGKRADLVVLDANPLRDIANTEKISQVWQRGRRVSGSVLDFKP